jgi:hypothetical protein
MWMIIANYYAAADKLLDLCFINTNEEKTSLIQMKPALKNDKCCLYNSI